MAGAAIVLSKAANTAALAAARCRLLEYLRLPEHAEHAERSAFPCARALKPPAQEELDLSAAHRHAKSSLCR